MMNLQKTKGGFIMIFVFFGIPLAIVWGVVYLIVNHTGKKKTDRESWTWAMAIVILLWNVFGGVCAYLGNNLTIGILMCAIGTPVLLGCMGSSIEEITNPEASKKAKKEIEEQDKYDNDWGYLNKK